MTSPSKGIFWHNYITKQEVFVIKKKLKFKYSLNTPCLKVASFHLEIKDDLLIASWPLPFRSTSEFSDSLLKLLRLIKEKEIRKLFLGTCNPNEGILTEEVIVFLEQQLFHRCPLQKVALLESTDFHWDNNIVQLINYLVLTFELDLQFRMFAYEEEAVAWLQDA